MPKTASSEERELHQQVATHSAAMRGSANTEPARAALWNKYLLSVDPDQVLPAAERHRRAVHARKAELARIALKAAQDRRRKKEAEEVQGLLGGES